LALRRPAQMPCKRHDHTRAKKGNQAQIRRTVVATHTPVSPKMEMCAECVSFARHRQRFRTDFTQTHDGFGTLICGPSQTRGTHASFTQLRVHSTGRRHGHVTSVGQGHAECEGTVRSTGAARHNTELGSTRSGKRWVHAIGSPWVGRSWRSRDKASEPRPSSTSGGRR
jgi:hypothetical protein